MCMHTPLPIPLIPLATCILITQTFTLSKAFKHPAGKGLTCGRNQAQPPHVILEVISEHYHLLCIETQPAGVGGENGCRQCLAQICSQEGWQGWAGQCIGWPRITRSWHKHKLALLLSARSTHTIKSISGSCVVYANVLGCLAASTQALGTKTACVIWAVLGLLM